MRRNGMRNQRLFTPDRIPPAPDKRGQPAPEFTVPSISGSSTPEAAVLVLVDEVEKVFEMSYGWPRFIAVPF